MEYSVNTAVASAMFIAIAVITAWSMDRIRFLPHLIDATVARNETIDGIRGLAAMFVFVNHGPFSLTNIGIKNNNFSPWGWIYPNLGSLGVQLFFCITGFLFFDRIIKRNGAIDWDYFYVSRIRRVIPMYVVSSLGVILIAFLFEKKSVVIDKDSLSVFGSIMTFGLIDGRSALWGVNLAALNSVTWTLIHEWRFYFALPAIAMLFKFKRLGVAFLLGAAFVAVIDFIVSNIVVWPYFVTGVVSAIILSRNVVLANRSRGWVMCGCILLFIYICGATLEKGYGWIRYVCSSALFIGLMLSAPAFLRPRALKYLGEISYSIYLVHLPVIYVVLMLVNKLAPLDSLSYYQFFGALAFGSFLTVVASSFTFKYVEYPFISKKQDNLPPVFDNRG